MHHDLLSLWRCNRPHSGHSSARTQFLVVLSLGRCVYAIVDHLLQNACQLFCRLTTWFTTRADENAADTGVTWPSPYITRLWKFFFKVELAGCWQQLLR
jgi:hypothetical protein